MSVTLLSTASSAALKITGGLYLADFLTGAFHWFEDRYGNPEWPVLGHTDPPEPAASPHAAQFFKRFVL